MQDLPILVWSHIYTFPRASLANAAFKVSKCQPWARIVEPGRVLSKLDAYCRSWTRIIEVERVLSFLDEIVSMLNSINQGCVKDEYLLSNLLPIFLVCVKYEYVLSFLDVTLT